MQDAAKLLRSYWYVWEGSCALILVMLAGLSFLPVPVNQSLRLMAAWLSFFMVLGSPWAILFGGLQIVLLRWLERRHKIALGSWVLSAVFGTLPLLGIALAIENHWTVPSQNYGCALIVLGVTLLSGFMLARLWKAGSPVFYSRGTGAVLGSAAGWTVGFYGPFVYRALFHIPGGNLTGLAEIFFWGLPFSFLGLWIGAAYVRLKEGL